MTLLNSLLKFFGLQKTSATRNSKVEVTQGSEMALSQTGFDGMSAEEGEENKAGSIFFVTVMLLFGGLILAMYAFSQGCLKGCDGEKSFWLIFGILAMVALTSSIVGAFIGFIFGLPKTPVAKDQESIGANNNLEEISDWLTKIIVGVSLVQLNEISGGITRLGDIISKGMGSQASAFVFSISIVIFYLIGGFFLGYLWSRIYLPKILKTSLEEGLRKAKKELREQKEQTKEKEEKLQIVLDKKDQQTELINEINEIKLKADAKDLKFFTPENFNREKLEALVERILKVFEGKEASTLFDKIISACYTVANYDLINHLTDKFKDKLEIDYKTWSDIAVTNMVLYNQTRSEKYKNRVKEALDRVRKLLFDDGVSYAIEMYMNLIDLETAGVSKDAKREEEIKNNMLAIFNEMKSRSEVTSWEAIRYFNSNNSSPTWSAFNKKMRELFKTEYEEILHKSVSYETISKTPKV